MANYIVRRDRDGKKEVVWQNTSLDKPKGWDIMDAAQREFGHVQFSELNFLSGIMSLTMKEGHSIL